MQTVEKSTCRSCAGFCPVNVTIESNRVIKVEGNPDAPLYEAFICPKGRALATTHNDPNRLMHHLKKMPDGSYQEISSEQLVEEISDKVKQILTEHGPDSVAGFLGGPVQDHQAMGALMNSFLQAIGSGSFYGNGTIDQPGINIADALHGTWAGGHTRQDRADVLVLVGSNPIISKQYFGQNPGVTLRRLTKNGMKLVVIDPRRTETARRAEVHLQVIPGEDPTVMAGLIHLIINNNAINDAFVELNTQGLEALTRAVSQFTPDYVAERAGVNADDLHKAAKILAEARTGMISTGVGPSMATRGNLTAYLGRCLQTLRGFWPGEGTQAFRSKVLQPRKEYKAQPNPPIPGWGFGKQLRVRGLQQTVAGMPVGALPEEILTPGKGQIKALFLHAGAMMTWPQTKLVKQALESLDLLVVHDVQRSLSETAKMATYVIATKNQFEVPAMTQLSDLLGDVHPGYGWEEPYAAYQPAILTPPEGADLLEPWQIYYRMAQKLGLSLKCCGFVQDPATAPSMDMSHEPSTEQIFELMCHNSVIPFSEVKKHPDGKVFKEAITFIGPRDKTCTARLELANPDMLEELAQVRNESYMKRRGTNKEFPFLYIPRRIQNTTNAAYRPEGILKTPYNPAYMHSSDLASLGLDPGDKVEIRTRHGAITGFVDIDDDLRPGVLSMCHGFGKNPGDKKYDPAKDGANVNELVHWEDDYDPYHGMPRMGALPVSIKQVQESADVA